MFTFGDEDSAEEVIGDEELGRLVVNEDAPAGVVGDRANDISVLVKRDA